MGDEHDGLALVDQALHDLEELVDLTGGQHRGRLVEDEDLGLSEQRLDELHPLLLTDRQVADQCVGVDVEAVALGDLDDACSCGGHVEEGAVGDLVAEHHVLGHREHRDQLEVLVHHPDPERDRICRTRERHRLPAHQDLAPRRLVQAEEHVHQRALAGSVLAEQAMDLALVQGEVDVLVRDDAGELLGDAPRLEDGNVAGFTHEADSATRMKKAPRSVTSTGPSTERWVC